MICGGVTSTGEWSGDFRGGISLASTLLERRDEAILYRDLSILRTDVPLHHGIDDLRWRDLDRTLLVAVTQPIEDVSVLPRLNRWSRLEEPFFAVPGEVERVRRSQRQQVYNAPKSEEK